LVVNYFHQIGSSDRANISFGANNQL